MIEIKASDVLANFARFSELWPAIPVIVISLLHQDASRRNKMSHVSSVTSV
jgi:hypothetical protein